MLDSRYTAQSSTKTFVTTAIASFTGIVAALPVALALFSVDGQAGALQDQVTTTTAQVGGVDANYAQYVHAYTQGLLASATEEATNEVVCVDTAASVDTDNGTVLPSGKNAVGGWGSGTAPAVGGYGNAPATGGYKYTPSSKQYGGSGSVSRVADVENSYNKYMSYVYNTAHTEIQNTNSNNVVGSYNSTKTEVSIEDSKGTHVDNTSVIDTSSYMIDDSFNEDSYNTSTESKTTVVNDSFNEDKTMIIDSGNTASFANDSYNDNSSETTTETNTETVTETTTETNIEVEVEAELEFVDDSYNDNTVIKENELEIS